MCKYSHYCSEWDDMLIDETNECEIACCLCFRDEEFILLKQAISNKLDGLREELNNV